MSGLVADMINGVAWRSNALLQGINVRRDRKLVPPGMDPGHLRLLPETVDLVAGQFVCGIDFLCDPLGRSGASLDTPRDPDHAEPVEKTTPPVILTPLRDGRWMVLQGRDRVRRALALGRKSLEVRVMPSNEARAGVLDPRHTFFPTWLHRHNLDLLEMVGEPDTELDAGMQDLAREIQADPLVRMADIYQPLPFPEFRDLSTQASDAATYARLGMILEVLPDPVGKRVLDLGCNVGFFLFSLARRGCRVSGLDLEPRFIEVGRRVAVAKGLRADFVTAPLEPGAFGPGGVLHKLQDHPAQDPAGQPWDLITCFSMLQWVARMSDLDCVRRILAEVSEYGSALLVDIPVNCSGVYLEGSPGREKQYLEELLRDSCGYTHYDYMGQVAPYNVDWRHVFHCHH